MAATVGRIPRDQALRGTVGPAILLEHADLVAGTGRIERDHRFDDGPGIVGADLRIRCAGGIGIAVGHLNHVTGVGRRRRRAQNQQRTQRSGHAG
jgi:hypothetical protein